MTSETINNDHPQSSGQHVIIVVLCLVILLAAVVLGRIEWFYTESRVGTIPSICSFKNLTGLPCPGCGLTRSWMAAALGDWETSLNDHRFGILLMLYAIMQLFRHAAWLMAPSIRTVVERMGWWLDKGILILMALLAINWYFVLKNL